MAVTKSSADSALITWTTNIQSTSEVNFGTTTGQYPLTISSTTTATSHSILLTGLDPAATYYFRVKSTYSTSYTSTAGEYTFTLGGVSAVSPTVVSTDTTSTTALENQLAQLQALLATLVAQAQALGIPVPGLTAGSGSGLSLLTQTMAFGSHASEVSLLQTILRDKTAVYPAGLVTGYFGQATLSAVRAFQTTYGISGSGKSDWGLVGPLTRKALNKLVSGGLLTPAYVAPVQTQSQTPAQPAKPASTATVTPVTTPTSSTTPTKPVTTPAVSITDTLSLGYTGGQVTLLQTILAKNTAFYPEGAITGIYDAATERAVERFQLYYKIVTPGDPEYGVVGVKTRGRMVQ